MNLSRIFHCSVINVLCFAVVQQLLYLMTEPSACQQLFYFSFSLPFSNFYILPEAKCFVNSFLRLFFCCPLRNISASRVSLKIISCCDVFVNNFFIFFLLSFEAVIRFAVSSIILAFSNRIVNQIFTYFYNFSYIILTFSYLILNLKVIKMLNLFPISKNRLYGFSYI